MKGKGYKEGDVVRAADMDLTAAERVQVSVPQSQFAKQFEGREDLIAALGGRTQGRQVIFENFDEATVQAIRAANENPQVSAADIHQIMARGRSADAGAGLGDGAVGRVNPKRLDETAIDYVTEREQAIYALSETKEEMDRLRRQLKGLGGQQAERVKAELKRLAVVARTLKVVQDAKIELKVRFDGAEFADGVEKLAKEHFDISEGVTFQHLNVAAAERTAAKYATDDGTMEKAARVARLIVDGAEVKKPAQELLAIDEALGRYRAQMEELHGSAGLEADSAAMIDIQAAVRAQVLLRGLSRRLEREGATKPVMDEIRATLANIDLTPRISRVREDAAAYLKEAQDNLSGRRSG